jgi:hypothetical protein
VNAKNPPDKCRLLAEKIAAIFKNGLTLNRETRHYIDSTFSSPSLKELERILNDESGCEAEPLRELVFFPDETMQAELEELLERHPFEKKDERIILNSLYSKRLATTLVFSNAREKLSLEIPKASAARFISRLNISKKIDPRLIKVMDKHVDKKYRNRFKVKLRNIRFDNSDNKIAFLGLFFAKMKAENKVVSECFDFLVALFDELKNDSDIYLSLVEKKRFYFRNLQKALKADAQLDKSNMETLIFQGVRIFYFDKEDARKKLEVIDTINKAVFGKTEHFVPAAVDIDLGELNRKNGLKKMFRMLS